MHTPAAADANPTIARTAAGGLSLGLFFAWVALGWNHTSSMFGLETTLPPLYHQSIQISVGLVLLAAALLPIPVSRRTSVVGAIAILGCTLATVFLVWCNPEGVPFVGSLCAGVGQGLFMALWLATYRASLYPMLLMLLGGSGIGYFLYLAAHLYSAGLSHVLAVALPVGAVALVMLPVSSSGLEKPLLAGDSRPLAAVHWNTGAPLVCLLLCNFAYGLVAYTSSMGLIEGYYLTAFALFAAAAFLLVLGRCPKSDSFFAVLSIIACAFVGLRLAWPQLPVVLEEGTFASFWVLSLYTMGLLVQRPASLQEPALRRAWGGWAIIYLVTAAANLLSMTLDERLRCTLALILTIASFAAAFVAVSRNQASAPAALEARKEPGPSTPDTRGPAERAQLTASESEVFHLLALGYSLKQIAERLHVTENTAKYHRHNVYQKLGVSSRQELIDLVHGEG